jgi:hypothetical protein
MTAPETAEQHPGGTRGAQTGPQAATDATVDAREAAETAANPAGRPWTPSTATTIKMKRACNGCGQRLGDVTDQEMACGINGLPLPDVRKECPTCGPTAPEPRCLPTRVLGGYPACLESDCDHDREPGIDYCDEIEEHFICVTHSEINSDGDITRPEPWPCQHAKAVTG